MLSAKREDELFVPTSLSHGDGLSVIDKFNTQQRPTNFALSVHIGLLKCSHDEFDDNSSD